MNDIQNIDPSEKNINNYALILMLLYFINDFYEKSFMQPPPLD